MLAGSATFAQPWCVCALTVMRHTSAGNSCRFPQSCALRRIAGVENRSDGGTRTALDDGNAVIERLQAEKRIGMRPSLPPKRIGRHVIVLDSTKHAPQAFTWQAAEGGVLCVKR